MSTVHCPDCDQQVGLVLDTCCLCGGRLAATKARARVPFHAWGGLLGAGLIAFAFYELAHADGFLGWPGVVALLVGPLVFGAAVADGEGEGAVRSSLATALGRIGLLK